MSKNPQSEKSKPSERLVSLDTLRGFDMFWIMGGDILIHLLAAASGWSALSLISDQLRHAPWDGLHAYDLVFPLFMFLSGISLSLSLEKSRGKDPGKTAILTRAARRMLILFLLGIAYNFGWDVTPERFRVASVLGQIGVAYFLTVLLFLSVPGWSGRVLALFALLLFVSALQNFFPVPGVGAGVLTPEGSINGWLDRQFLPGRLYGETYDPEGLLNMISAVAVTVLGGLAGGLVGQARQQGLSPSIILCRLVALAVGLLALGYGPGIEYPVIKKAWTVPFSLVTAGYSTVLFALFYWLFDCLKLKWAGFVFSVIGINSIGIYLGARFAGYPLFFWARSADIFADPLPAAALMAIVLGAEWLVLYVCYRRGWFLKV